MSRFRMGYSISVLSRIPLLSKLIEAGRQEWVVSRTSE